jgi:hypothetical protein
VTLAGVRSVWRKKIITGTTYSTQAIACNQDVVGWMFWSGRVVAVLGRDRISEAALLELMNATDVKFPN